MFACDAAPEMDTEAPGGMVKVYPRPIDLQNTERLGRMDYTEVVLSVADLNRALESYL